MDIETDSTPLRLRSVYPQHETPLLYDALARCLTERDKPVSYFYRNELLPMVRLHAKRFIDDSNKNPGLLQPAGEEADLKAFRRYLASGGLSAPLKVHQLVHAYLQVAAPDKLASINPFRTSQSVGRGLAEFLKESSSLATNVQDVKSLDSSEISTVLRYSVPKEGDVAYLVFFKQKPGNNYVCFEITMALTPSHDGVSTNIKLRYGFCVKEMGVVFIVMRSLRDAERYMGFMEATYSNKEDLYENFDEVHFVTVDVRSSSPKTENPTPLSFMNRQNEEVAPGVRWTVSRFLAAKLEDQSRISTLKKIIEKFRMEYL